MNDRFRHDPAKMYDGISAQYGMKGRDQETSDSVYFNFTVYENGEVQVRGYAGKDYATIVLGQGAFRELVALYAKAVNKAVAVSCSGHYSEA